MKFGNPFKKCPENHISVETLRHREQSLIETMWDFLSNNDELGEEAADILKYLLQLASVLDLGEKD